MRFARTLVAFSSLAVLTSSLSCQGNSAKPPAAPPTPAAPAPPVSSELNVVKTDEPGLTFTLHEGVEAGGKREVVPPAKATPLSDADTASVLARMAPLKVDADDQQDFALREKSLPPPRTGKNVKSAFPPADSAAVVNPEEAGALSVPRHMPDGEVPLAPHVSLSFSQPMVPVTSYAELEKLPVPVKLTPQPPGRWRWVGTKTLLFEVDAAADATKKQDTAPTRLPMATDYVLEVPAGTKSATGGTLAKAATFKFSTPPVKVIGFQPRDIPTRRDPLMLATFDQRIDAQALLPSIKVSANGQTFPVRLATDDEIKADKSLTNVVAGLTAGGQASRYVIFRAVDKLPVDAAVSVTFAAGTPSAEGPRKTTVVQSFSFHTYGPLKVTYKNCQTEKEQCAPYSSFAIQLSNPLDLKLFKKEMITVEPALPGLKVYASGNYLNISGRSKGRSTYKVTLAATLPDEFGQTLGQPETLTFVTTSAQKSLFATGGQMVVLDPAAGPRFSVYSVNHEQLHVKVFAQSPEGFDAFAKFYREQWQREQFPPDPPGKKVVDEVVKVTGAADELTETRVDLTPALQGGRGSVLLLVEPTERPKNRYEWQPILVWVQVTQLGLDAMVDEDQLIGWVNDLATGAPLAGVDLSIAPSGLSGMTGKSDAQGLATLPLSSTAGRMLVARHGNDVAFLPENPNFWSDSGSWQRREMPEIVRWYIADDRRMYRPGEEVHLKGWLRRVGAGRLGDLEALDGAVHVVNYVVKDSQGNEIVKASANISGLGGFDTAFTLPKTVNTGAVEIDFSSDASIGGGSSYHQIEVEEFRRPEFEVAAKADEGPFFVGGHATVSVSASYFAGGGLGNADTAWEVRPSPGFFTPPNRDEFVFGEQASWWDEYRGGRSSGEREQSFAAKTDGAGKHVLGIDFLAVNPPRPMVLNAQATVMDVNRQAWTANASLLVHPASRYVGLKSDRPFVQQGDPLKIDVIMTDLDGKAVVGQPIAVRAVRMDWDQEDGVVKMKEVDAHDCPLTSAEQPGTCTFKPGEGGLYKITAVIHDDKGRPNQSSLSIWVAGGKLPAERGVTQERARLLPDKKEYHAGDTAEILVIPPWYPAEGVMTLRRSGIFKVERFSITGPSYTLKVKLEDGYTPNLTVQVDLVGAAPRTNDQGEVAPKLPKRPAYASGELGIAIPPLSRKLALTVTPKEAKLEPGAQTSVHVELKDANGAPVQGGEVAVIIVDEAVLSLTGYRLPTPLGVFYAGRGTDTRDYHSRAELVLAKPDELQPNADRDADGLPDSSDAPQGATRAPGAPPPPPAAPVVMSAAKIMIKTPAAQPAATPIKVRTDFNALALFAPAVATDANGAADVVVKLPDNLTRYRVMAIAVAGKRQFGAGEATITARLPLMVRPSPPRFLNFGDKLELPVVLQNQTDLPLQVRIAVRVANLELTAGGGRLVTVPANDRVEVRFPASALKAGTARLQLAAVVDDHPTWTDAAELSLPVWTPATTEAFATYGTIDASGAAGAVAQPVKTPGAVFPQFGGVTITTSSTALQALTDAVIYLVRYPYECSEQMASRMMSIAALRDVLAAFAAPGLPPTEVLIASVDSDLELLRRLQNDDGGWGFWKHGEDSWPFLTIHVVHALQRAKEKGFTVPQAMIDRAMPYLKDIEAHIPSWYGAEERRALIGFSIYVRARLGDVDGPKAVKLAHDAGGIDKLPLEAVGWIYPVIAVDANATAELAAIRKLLANRVEETAGAAHFVTSYADGNYLLLASDRRLDALFLEGMIGDQPKSDLIPKLVEGLLAHRKAGHWESTQEDAWVLLALDKYFNTYEKATPDFVAKAWLGPQLAGDHTFKGRTTERYGIDVPMKWLVDQTKSAADGTTNLVIEKDGPGRLYYRVGMDYAPTDLKMPPRDNGFTVEREYAAVDEKGDVRRDADGTWHFKAGARVRVRLTMVAPARRYHVALVDPMPAGIEAMNPALATTGVVPQDPKAQGASGGGNYWAWWGPWYQHQNLRDERVEAFTTLLWEGVYTYSYVARATTPGVFVVPPTKAEEMYHPETFGRGASDRVVVE